MAENKVKDDIVQKKLHDIFTNPLKNLICTGELDNSIMCNSTMRCHIVNAPKETIYKKDIYHIGIEEAIETIQNDPSLKTQKEFSDMNLFKKCVKNELLYEKTT